MTREEANEAIKVMSAYANGRDIQYLDDNGRWVNTTNPSFDWGRLNYRIKPEPNYRPFKNVEECWQEMRKHHPFGWIKNKNDGHYSMVTKVDAAADEDKKHIEISGSNIWTLSETMCDYTFADGEPFGINIDEE